MIRIKTWLLWLVLLIGCQKDMLYTYDLEVVNIGDKEVIGMTIYFDQREIGFGVLGANAEYSATYVLFETSVPYPTKVAYEQRNEENQEEHVEINSIQITGKLIPHNYKQLLQVRIDTTNKTASATVSSKYVQ